MGRLDGRVAIVTGAARGMGASHTRAFISEGARVLLTDRLEDSGEALADELGENARFEAHDVTLADAWDRAVTAAEGNLDGATVVCHSMGNLVALGALTDDAARSRVRHLVLVNPVTGNSSKGAPTARLQGPLVRTDEDDTPLRNSHAVPANSVSLRAKETELARES